MGGLRNPDVDKRTGKRTAITRNDSSSHIAEAARSVRRGGQRAPVSDDVGAERTESVAEGPAKGSSPAIRRDTWFGLGMLALGVITVFILSHGGSSFGSSNRNAAITRPIATATQSGSSAAQPRIIAAQERVYSLPQPAAGLMQPAVDAQGNVWVGMMQTNQLARLDSKTGAVTTWTPPNGKFGIMATAVDAQGRVWFTEQNANYIGRFDPATQQFTTYPLEAVNGHASAPQDLIFDKAGMLWFTEIGATKIGRLDPTTGAITTWNAPKPKSASSAWLFSLTTLPDGSVWFGYLGGALGRLDPTTGATQLYATGDANAQLYAMAGDAQGRIWFTELSQGKLGMLDPATGKVTEIRVPTTTSAPASGLYDIVTTRDGSVWFADASANALVRYTPQNGQFSFYQLAEPSSIPFGLALDTTGALWFTADSNPNNYIGVIRP